MPTVCDGRSHMFKPRNTVLATYHCLSLGWNKGQNYVISCCNSFYNNMESALFMWLTNASAQNIPISDKILRTKVKQFRNGVGVSTILKQRLVSLLVVCNFRSLTIDFLWSAGVDHNLIMGGQQKAVNVIKG